MAALARRPFRERPPWIMLIMPKQSDNTLTKC
jgi:hypothetical protein